MNFADLEVYLGDCGLHVRGVLTLADEESELLQVEADSDASIVLVGNLGSSYWSVFSESPEYKDGQSDPLDRWSKRVAEQVADRFRVRPIYPFEGPPYHPFLQWAKRADALRQSPLGLMIHSQYGLWHSYRFGLLISQSQQRERHISVESPCLSCELQPCLHSCPVDAFDANGYDVGTCATYLKETANASCHQQGCLARLACPIGAAYRYNSEQHIFHLRAFLGAR